ncbi:MAG: hypothetical protein JXR83_05470, partial [Deltaproteobacteria bacterium]|nr:hypothetical protein [Deltaproteobacteria bacterium]
APCLDVAFEIGGRTIAADDDGRLHALIAPEDEPPPLALLLWATCTGDVSLPIVRASPVEQPWLETTTPPRLVQLR